MHTKNTTRRLAGVAPALLVLALLAGGLAPLTAQSYDRTEVVKAMRQNGTLLGQAKTAVNGEKWWEAAQAFYELARINQALKAYTPKKGDKAAWDKVFDDLVSAALRGVGATGSRDKAAADKALADINAAMMAGHRSFK